ncbi:amidohydrolase family protein [Algivirga pacifica]|uniref:Amidohydrolase family protein n=1 Tax=Algivirga pacifica TaxID=1162670 RepID=A0ABP9D949_9BACT
MKLLFTLLLITTSFGAVAQQTYLHCGLLIDGESDKPSKNMTIILEGKTIKKVQKGFVVGNDADTVIDLKAYTVMPGLMDTHVHLEKEFDKNSYMDRFTLNEADIAFRSAEYAKRTVMAGFTTVRDLGGTGVNISLMKAIDKGLVVGPRIYTAGKSIATTGGHADPSNGMKQAFMGDPGPDKGVINGIAEARKAVRQRYKNGANTIKITATGGVLSVAKDSKGAQFMMDELEAIVATAKDYGFVTAAHAHGAEGMKRAVLAGISSIEHGTEMTEEIMDLMIERGTYLVPTITAGKEVTEKAHVHGYYPEVVVPKAKAIGPQIQGTFGRAYKRGVKIAFGTDAGVFPHGQNWKEFGYMVEAGMPPMEAIKSATMEAAKLLRVENELGSIEEGKLADIIAVEGNPLEDMSVMENVFFVMKEGEVLK